MGLILLCLLCAAQQLSAQQEVCYPGLGCFNNGGNFYDPLRRPLQVLPQSPDVIKPTYALFTRRNPNAQQNLVFNNKASVTNSNFNAKLPTKITIHGYTDSIKSDWHPLMKNALLANGDFNVILLDWSSGNRPPYIQATSNTRIVGALLAQLIVWLETEFGANRETFHLLGHSLGSHIAGYAGERLRTVTRQLGRITGLDAAGPYFENTHPAVRLDPTDARFVDAIHTDGDSNLSIAKLEGGFGLMQAIGHVDFYPNGGKKQPNCNTPPSGSVNGIIQGTIWRMGCSHQRVVAVMTSTIANKAGNYKAFPCGSYEDFKAGKCRDCGAVGCAQMGMRASEWNPSGRINVKMFLDTAGTEPYQSL